MNTPRFSPDFSMHDFMKGQPRAFSYVFDHYYNAIHFFATKIIRDSPAAEDITQETFIKLWEKHTGFQNPYAIKAFLYITTRNACYNFIKRAQTGMKHHQQWSQGWDEAEENILNQLVRSETIRDVYVLLNALPPECRKIVRYYFIDGKDNREIASILNISVHTVKNQKARAIFLIKKRLGNRALLALTIALLAETHSGQLPTPANFILPGTVTCTVATPSKFYAITSSLKKTAADVPLIFLKCASYTVWFINFFG